MRCLHIHETESDPSLLDSVSNTSAKAVIVINNMDSFQLEDSAYALCSLPIIVLCSSAGNRLKAILTRKSEVQIEAFISSRPLQEEICKLIKPFVNNSHFYDSLSINLLGQDIGDEHREIGCKDDGKCY